MNESLVAGTESAGSPGAERSRWRLTIGRGTRRVGAQRRPALPRLAVVIGAAGLALGVTALPASGSSTNGSSTATVNIAVRSITVSPGSVTFDNCVTNFGASTLGVLAFPNGTCVTASAANAVTITNGQAPSHVDISGADAVPSDGGVHWTLCGGAPAGGGLPCTGSGAPGQDQYLELSGQSGFSSPLLTDSPQCDTSFSTSTAPGTCFVGANGQGVEQLHLEGPTVSTDNSSSFSMVWTWTALP